MLRKPPPTRKPRLDEEATAQADDSDSYDWYGDGGDNWES